MVQRMLNGNSNFNVLPTLQFISKLIGQTVIILMVILLIANITRTPKPVEPIEQAAPVVVKQKDPFTLAYIERFKKVAKAEQEKFGIPAAIKLGQAIKESRSGRSRLAIANNNHFGLKCFSRTCKKDHCSNYNDDHHKDFFRKYKSAWESWRDHSQFLTGARYKHLLELPVTDYKGWAKGLKKAGYATDKKYDKDLIELIEFYELHKI